MEMYIVILLSVITTILPINVLSIKYETPDLCSWTNLNDTSKVSVWCRLGTLQKLSTTNFVNNLQADGLARLRLECNDVLYFESSLSPGTFQRLNQLEDLEIENCKLSDLEEGVFHGLRDLKRVSIRTHNALWSTSRNLEITAESFDGLKELNVLDLAENNIKDVPSLTFCALSNLNILNLSHNALDKIDPVLLGEQNDVEKTICGVDVLTLDVSYNKLTDLPSLLTTTPRRRRLQTLFVNDNQLTALRASSLAGLSALRIIYASGNRLVHLPAVPLRESCRELREIHLGNNDLHVLGDAFQRLEQLLVLDLSRNQLVDLDNSLSGLIRLIVLDLAGNALSRLEAHAFKDLYSLQILDLRDNAITHIADDAFLPLYNLHTLNLAGNQLTTITAATLNGLFVLNKLTLSLNLITNIDPQAFRNCSDLKELDLSGNVLTEVPAALTELTFLRTLDLGENRITTFKNGSFRNLVQLTGLRLIDNNIGNVTAGMLWDLTGIQVLNLAKNKIQHVERGSFDRNEKLEAIRLDANYLTDVNGVFTTLPNLMWLNLSSNHLVWFDYAFIPTSLQWLDISTNFIEKLGNYYKIAENFHLKTLDASRNRLTELTVLSVPNSVEVLFANENQITNVAPGTFSAKENLTRVDLYGNELEYLDLSSLRVNRATNANTKINDDKQLSVDNFISNNKATAEFFLGGNPFRCDCSMEWLQHLYNYTHSMHNYINIMDSEDVVCRLTHDRGAIDYNMTSFSLLPVSTVNPSSFLCRYETYCSSQCHCCDFDACDCEMTCPQNCSCYHDQTWNTNVVDCSSNFHIALPNRIPMDTTDLFMDGNNIQELNNHVFIARKMMLNVYLNFSNIERIQNKTFNGLVSLKTLYLNNNKLTILHGYEFEPLPSLQELYLQNNFISYIGNTTFNTLASLKVLNLHNNRLAYFAMWQIPVYNYQLTTMTLENNQWTCKCRFSSELKSWLAIENHKVLDKGGDKCIENIDTCVKEEEEIGQKSNYNTSSGKNNGEAIPRLLMNDYLPTIISTFILVIIVLVVAILAFAYRDNVKLWVFERYGIRLSQKAPSTAGVPTLKQNRDDRDRLYDSYICYSPKDEENMVAGLNTGLEAMGYRVCLHHRDLLCSEGSRDSAVIEAVDASRRVFLVVTRGFLQTEWPRRELRAYLHEALHNKTHKLVIIEETGGLPPEVERDPDLKPYLKTAKRIRWGEKKFWERLRYAMPEVSRHARENQYRQNINYTIDRRPITTPAPIHHHNVPTTNTYPGKRKPIPTPIAQLNNHPLFNFKIEVPAPSPSPRNSEHIYSYIDADYIRHANWEMNSAVWNQSNSTTTSSIPPVAPSPTNWNPTVAMLRDNNNGDAFLV